MPTVHIPSALRTLTSGEAIVEVRAETLADAFDELDVRFPGIKARLVDGDRLRGGLAVFVNDQLPTTGLRTRLEPGAQIYFAPAIAGG